MKKRSKILLGIGSAVVVLVLLFILGNMRKDRFSETWENEFLGNRTDVPFFPDGNANYWTYTFDSSKEIYLKIRGKLPNARYMSINLYRDRDRSSIGSLTDVNIKDFDGDNYEVVIAPENYIHPNGNVLFYPVDSGSFSVFLRYYLPEGDPYGDTALPNIEAYDVSTGEKVALPHKKLNRFGAERLKGIFQNVLRRKIAKRKFDQGDKTIYSYRSTGAGFYENKDNAYLVMPIQKGNDEMAILRFLPPTHSEEMFPKNQREVRYWSIGQGDLETNNWLTMHDGAMRVAKDGFVYLAVGNDIEGPNTTIYNKMSWFVEGDKMILIYRNLFPNVDFEQAVQNVPSFIDNDVTVKSAGHYIGEYAPSGLIVKKEDFKKSGFALLRESMPLQ